MKPLIIFILLVPMLHVIASLPELKIWSAPKNHAEQLSPDVLSHKFIALHFQNAQTVLALITKNRQRFLSSNGRIIAIPKKNWLYIIDTPDNIKAVKAFITSIDSKRTEIRIRAQLVSIDTHCIKNLGLSFSQETIAPSSNSFNHAILHLGESALFAKIEALSEKGHASIIAKPMLLTMQNHPAIIESGEEVPYQQRGKLGAISVAFKKAVLKLEVTPHIITKNQLQLDINIHQDKLSKLSVNGAPIIQTQQIQTQALIQNKATLILGGILQNKIEHRVNGIAGLMQLPLIGHLFQKQETQQQQRELLIFITPTILVKPEPQH